MIQFHTYISELFFRFFSQIGYCKILSIVPCAIQYVLVYLFLYIASVYMLLQAGSLPEASCCLGLRLSPEKSIVSPVPPSVRGKLSLDLDIPDDGCVAVQGRGPWS